MFIKRPSDSDKLNNVVLEIYQGEYLFWDHFCDYYTEKYNKILSEQVLPEDKLQRLLKAKETLESILFHVDVYRENKNCTVYVPKIVLSILKRTMGEWNNVLHDEIKKRQMKLKRTTNGENKRQLSDELKRLEKEAELNFVFIAQINEFTKRIR